MKLDWKVLFGVVLAFLLGIWVSNVSVIRMTAEAWAWWMVLAGFFLSCATFTGDVDTSIGSFVMSCIGIFVSFLCIFQPMTKGVDFYQTVFVVVSLNSLFITINLVNKLAIWMKERRKFEQDKKRMELLTT